jgi:two-component system phosphate regulon sensor histidine kinase PhoR
LEDLDEISRLETDRFELKIKKFDLVSVIKDVFNELETKASNKQIKLSFDRHYEPLYVSADQSKITQVLVNLISNSISYGINGGTTKLKLITIDRKKLMVEVTDN